MGRRKRRNRLPAEPVEVSIESLSHDGKGVSHVEEKALFVTGALPGEKVMARYVKKQKRYDEAVVTEVLVPAANRIAARCSVFGICGGCSLQHLSDTDQIQSKQQALIETLKRIGNVSADKIMPPLVNETPWGYRRKARLGVKYVHKKERVLVGFRERGTSFITETETCHVLHPKVGTQIQNLAQLINSLTIRDKVPQIEVAVDDNSCVLVFRILEPLAETDREKLKSYASEQQMTIYLQPGGPDSITALQGEIRELQYCLPDYDLCYDFRATDFTQVNSDINRKMINLAIELLQINDNDKVLDLFCGLGNFTLPLASKAKEVVGVEGDLALIERAHDNAKKNNILNTRYFLANLYESIDQQIWKNEKFDKILLDPPRSGALEIVNIIEKFNARRIVYVSCYPGTLARDLDILVNEKGYHLESVAVMDMFPHTGHVESIALLTKK